MFNIYRNFTTDGVTYGGSQAIITGTSIRFLDIVATSDSQLYATQKISYGNGVYGSVPGVSGAILYGGGVVAGTLNGSQQDSIWSISHNGTAWGYTLLYLGNVYQSIKGIVYGSSGLEDGYQRKSLLAKKINNTDRILHIGGRNSSGDGLHVIETDGVNLFSDTEVIDQNCQTDRRIILGNFVNVSSMFYLPMFIEDIRVAYYTGKPSVEFNQYGLHLMQSADFKNWSLPIYIGGSNYNDVNGNLNCGIISGGTMTNLFSIISMLGTRLDFNKGSSSLDVSANVIDYSNQNNERLTITLGNLNNG